jgi:CrcB protein
MLYLLVFIGAGLGGIMRYFCSTAMLRAFGPSFPFGTFTVNMIGCLLIGLIAHLAETRSYLSQEMRTFLVVGILGGYTTFSSFGYETVTLLRDGHLTLALLNAGGQLVLGLVCVWLGMQVAKIL